MQLQLAQRSGHFGHQLGCKSHAHAASWPAHALKARVKTLITLVKPFYLWPLRERERGCRCCVVAGNRKIVVAHTKNIYERDPRFQTQNIESTLPTVMFSIDTTKNSYFLKLQIILRAIFIGKTTLI